ncbi:NAD-dependent epimerase [Parapedobacter soli]|uniref:NAD-dependent epimerase n=1 Tax=Parapedobacter soli TaxID=416955 RepID=UPI0021C9490D|nr:NAD-dependent epimerase [Parapedobacter soli]
MSKKTILVTGTAGFIGFHLAEALLRQGHHVVGIDSINDYYDVDLKYTRLAVSGITKDKIRPGTPIQSQLHANYVFQQQDIADRSDVEQLFTDYAFDCVIHLAAQPGVRYSLENPHAYIQANVVGFINILECCRHHRIQHLVYASSSSVYGMNAKTPFNEDDPVDHPVSLYAATKKSNELMAHTYSHLYQLPTTGLRFFTVYGPWGRPDMAPMLFADAISKGESIKVFNGGDMQRDFTYVDDIVEGVIRVSENPPTAQETRPFYRLFNIGNSQPVALMDFIRAMEYGMDKEAQLALYPMQPGDVKVTFADTRKLEAATGYKPGTDLDTGVHRFVAWYRDYQSGRFVNDRTGAFVASKQSQEADDPERP